MHKQRLELLATLRTVVGYLGEKGQHGWWSSSFFGGASKAFLVPVFPRSLLLAQYHGVVEGASRVHDEHIGVGQVYHLFRLPEDIEYGLHQALNEEGLIGSVADAVSSPASALKALRLAGNVDVAGSEGPTLVGSRQGIRESGPWQKAAAEYAHAFANGKRVYPYFSDAQ